MSLTGVDAYIGDWEEGGFVVVEVGTGADEEVACVFGAGDAVGSCEDCGGVQD